MAIRPECPVHVSIMLHLSVWQLPYII
uniref:Uncharacterized protein n=1 Tax=Arundo donax TaxID=35708 RepID=A0A0A8YVI1_ARUDO